MRTLVKATYNFYVIYRIHHNLTIPQNLQLLKLSQQEIMDNTYQIFPLYFILVVLPLIIPTAISVILSFAVLIRILVKRHRYVAYVNLPLIKITASWNEAALSYFKVRGLYLLPVISAATIIM